MAYAVQMHVTMTMPDWESERRGANGTIFTDVPRRRRDWEPEPRWKRLLRVGFQGLGAVILIAAGTIWTFNQQKPKYLKPGELLRLPAVAVAPNRQKPSEQAFRMSRVILKYTKDTSRAERIAEALIREGGKKHIDPVLLVGLLITENAKFDTTARSNVSARGLMQVMPFHAGQWGCSSGNLMDVDTNICHGVAILASYIKGSPNLQKALLRYNGCVRGTNTPRCHTYSGKVMKFADQVASQMLSVDIAGDNE
ncbi:MAG: transglycosylase SLT domain-containing protein [Gemmatimonadaceae bacterium]|nr:transglycosylase SLT domain-containing protein [Gemmatimonadaceae bacterium]